MVNEARTKQSAAGLTNEQLAARIHAGEDPIESMNQLYDQVNPLIHLIARRFRGCGVDLEDLEQEGFLALYDAVAGYDPEKGVKFSTYAGKWIFSKMARYIQENGSFLRLPVYSQEQIRRYGRFCNAFRVKYGREPSEAVTAAFLDVTLEQVRQIKENAAMTSLASLDAPVAGSDGDEDTTLGDMQAAGGDLEDDVLEKVQQQELQRVLWECVDGLPGGLPEVIRRRYQGGESLKQIGQAAGITIEAVRQQEAKALRELRQPSRARLLLPFLEEDERIYSASLKGGGAAVFRCTWTSSTERVALRRVESTEDILRRERKEKEKLLAEVRKEWETAADSQRK